MGQQSYLWSSQEKATWPLEGHLALYATQRTLVPPYNYLKSNMILPLSLVYGTKAMTLEEPTHESPRVTFTPKEDEDNAHESLKETRLQAVANLKRYQEETKSWRNKLASPWSFAPSDMVLRLKPGHVPKLHPK